MRGFINSLVDLSSLAKENPVKDAAPEESGDRKNENPA
jgi:hypothetical protein